MSFLLACRHGAAILTLMTTTQTTGFETSSLDYSSRVNVARRSDGQWFTRYQVRDPRYGYRWGAWRKSSVDSENEYRLRPVAWRLPKG